MEFTAKEIAGILGGTVDGNPEAKVTTFARIESGKPGAICFFANPKYEHYVYECKADIIIVNNTFEPKEPVSATMLRVEDSYAAVAALLENVTAKKIEELWNDMENTISLLKKSVNLAII